MQKTLREIASFLGAEVAGNAGTVITGVSGIKEARKGDITFLANTKYLSLLEETKASAVILSRKIKIGNLSMSFIVTEEPSLAFAKIVSWLAPCQIQHPKGIHPTALIGKGVFLGKEIALGPYVVVGDNVSIGDRTIVYSGSFIGDDTKIGADTLIYPNVSVRERISIGSRVIIHSGTVIGSDGFGFVSVDGRHHKIPQTGTVEIGDDVEIGANVTIDRARFDKTIVGKGTKIDNLVQIAHNVIIGENTLIISQVGISGSTVIGNNAVLAGQAGFVGHITIGDGAIIAAQAGVTKSVSANTFVSGYPARPHSEAKKVNACLQRLPRLYEEVSALKKRLAELEK